MVSVFRDLGVILKDSQPNLNQTADDRNIYQLIEPGWLVVNRMKAWQGSVGVSRVRGICSGHYLCFRPVHGEDSGYLNWLLRSSTYAGGLACYSRGVRPGQAEIDNSYLRLLPILLPPLKEQVAIADFLDRETAKIDALIEKQGALVVGLRERRAATVNRALALAPGVQGVPLRTLAQIQTGITLGKDYSGQGTVEYPYLRVANVQVGLVDLSDIAVIALPRQAAAGSTLRRGDVLMTEGGDRASLGRGSLWDGALDPCLHQNHVFAVRPDLAKLVPEYLIYVLEADGARRYFESTRRQTTNLSATNARLVRAFRFTLPSLAEQASIVRSLDRAIAQIAAAVDALDRAIELAKERRAALITAAVTGQLDVATGKVA